MHNKKWLIFPVLILLLAGCTSHMPHTGSRIERKHYGDWEPQIGYTQVVRTGNVLYLAGITGEGKTQLEQLKHIYRTIEKILSDYHATTSDIVKEVVYTTDIDELITAIDVRKTYFSAGQYPASTWVQVQRLFREDLKIEVEITVQLPNRAGSNSF